VTDPVLPPAQNPAEPEAEHRGASETRGDLMMVLLVAAAAALAIRVRSGSPRTDLAGALEHGWNALCAAAGIPPAWAACGALCASVWALARALEERSGHPFTSRLAALAVGLSAPALGSVARGESSSVVLLCGALTVWSVQYVENEAELRAWHGLWLGAVLAFCGLCGPAFPALALAAGTHAVFHVVRGHAPAGLRRWAVFLAGGLAGAVVVLGPALAGGWRLAEAPPTGTRLVASLTEVLAAFHLMVPMGLMALQRARGWPALVGVLITGATPGQGALPLMFFALMAHDALASVAYALPRLRRTVFIRAQLGLLLLAMGLATAVAAWRL
jgi:hypothetical protein